MRLTFVLITGKKPVNLLTAEIIRIHRYRVREEERERESVCD